MIHHKPEGFPGAYLPRQHAFLSEKWDHQQKVPAGAERQSYDSTRRTLSFIINGEQQEIPVSVAPLWTGKDVGEWNG